MALSGSAEPHTACWVELSALLLLAQFGQAAACIACQLAGDSYAWLRDSEQEVSASATGKGGAAPSGCGSSAVLSSAASLPCWPRCLR